MAFNAWLNIPLSDYRAGLVYRAWAAVSLLSGGMAGAVTVVQASSAGWTSDTSPGDGGWVVLQWTNAWATGEHMQVFIGARLTSGAMAGFGTKAAGVWVAVSPTGGWDTTNHWFGASLADWRNGSIKSCIQTGTATTMAMFLTSGVPSLRPGAIGFACRAGSGSHTTGCYAGALYATSPELDKKYRVAILAGQADPNNTSGFWGVLTGASGLVPKTTLDGWQPAFATYIGMPSPCNVAAAFQQDIDGGYNAAPQAVFNVTQARTMGFLDGIVFYGLAIDGTFSTSNDLWFWNWFGWPREAARDGSWV